MTEKMKAMYLEYYHTDDNLVSEASALYDGGWRSGDENQLVFQYKMSLNHAQALCLLLEEFEQEEKQ